MSSVCSINEESIECKLGRILISEGLKITTAESCTGGLVAAALVNVDGISQVFERGYVTYSDEAKASMLGVSHDTLKLYGAVSAETAKEMAEGAAKTANADVAIATTGLAGPAGGTEEKPVGLVYIGVYIKGKTKVKAAFFRGNREEIRNSALKEALELTYCMMISGCSAGGTLCEA